MYRHESSSVDAIKHALAAKGKNFFDLVRNPPAASSAWSSKESAIIRNSRIFLQKRKNKS